MNLKNLSVTIKIPKLFKDKLKNTKINRIYKEFEKSINLKKEFIVAVSGGPDSLALAFLSKIYSIKNKIGMKCIIVDHKLRPESTKEAKFVKNVLKKNFIDTEILTWKGKKPSNNIQSKARKKRYELLLKRCDQLKIENILLGHHLDDLLENFFIRLLRGSGLKGLVSLSKKTTVNNINILRPFLELKKNDLEFISGNVFNFYVQDPFNKDDKYLRIKIRNLIRNLEKEGLDKKNFFKTIKNLKYSDAVVNFYVNENIKKNTFFSTKDNRLIINEDFFQQPHEVIFRSLSEAIRLISKKYYSVRGKKLENIIEKIENNNCFKQTLSGCIIEKVEQTVIISKEY
jgi:tRNA(Ile)-lysidine synthase